MLDGFFLSFIIDEIQNRILNCYVDKLYQPSKNEIVLHFRTKNNPKLLISANPTQSRIGFINGNIENPQVPSMFCMLLRKYLVNAKLVNVCQYNFERLVFFDFYTSNEVGDKISVRLVIEVMGKHSNFILLNQANVIIDSVKRIGSNMSRVRQVLPGMTYQLPPLLDKFNIINNSVDEIVNRILLFTNSILSEAIVKSIQGISFTMADEISFVIAKTRYFKIQDLNFNQIEQLKKSISDLKIIIENKIGTPFLFKTSDGKMKDFYFTKLCKFKDNSIVSKKSSYSELIEEFYKSKSDECRIKQNANDVLKILASNLKKAKKKLKIQKLEKLNCGHKNKIQECAILLQSNLHLVNKNSSYIVVENFFNDNKKVKIELDSTISGAANAQKYFNKYKKLCVADKVLDELIVKTQNEIIYLESVIDAVIRSTSIENIMQIKIELQQEGYLKKHIKHAKNVKTKYPKNSVLKIKSIDNFDILVGNNNVNNDWLTLKYANKNDIWFHTQKIPGAHVVIVTNGKEVPNTTIVQAAKIAAEHSRAKNDNLVSVDYTTIKNVKKIAGAKPGMVIYNNFKTVVVKPELN